MADERKPSLSEALVQVTRTCAKCGAVAESMKCSCGARLKARPVKEVIDQALALWQSPAGKTPKATASSRLLDLARKGLVVKPERGLVLAQFPK